MHNATPATLNQMQSGCKWMEFMAKTLAWQTLAPVLASLTTERKKEKKKKISMEEGRKLVVIDKDKEQLPKLLEEGEQTSGSTRGKKFKV